MFNPEIPPVLKRNPELCVERDPTGRHLPVGYSALNPSRVDRAILDAAEASDGQRPVPSQNPVRSLYHHRILVNAGEPGVT